jgi:hypothetical protein
MRLALPLITLAVVALSPLAVRADEPAETQMEFVRKLRAKGYGDLALEYLERLKKNPPPGIGPLLPLELARTRINMARDKGPGQRLALYAEARSELEKYLQAAAGKPEATQVRLEVARIATYEGEARLSQAFAKEDEKDREAFARKAEERFQQSGKELEAAITASEALLKAGFKGTNPEEEKVFKQQLAVDILQAKLQRGRAYLEQARTYLDLDKTAVREKRGKLIETGRDILKDVAKDTEGVSPATSYLAYAWLIKAAYDLQDPDAAHKYYLQVIGTKNREAMPARRLAKLLWIQHIDEDVTIKATPQQKLKVVKDEAQKWLDTYPSYKNSPEGQAVRFELAQALLQESLTLSKDLKTPQSKKLAKDAQKILASLAESDSDFSRKAQQLDVMISLKQMGENKSVDKLKDFDECFLKARFEMSKVEQVGQQLKAKPGDAALEGERKQHLKDVIAALDRGLTLATPKTPPSQVNRARYFLTVTYLLTGEPEKAAEQGELLARAKQPSKWSSQAAGYALQAWANLVDRDATNEKARKHLQELAKFIADDKATVWKGEPVMPIARYQLALLAMRDRNHREAVEQLEKLPQDFSAYVFAQCQAAFEALLVAAKDVRTDDEKAAWKQRALAILKRVSKLPDNADSPTAQMFFAAQIEQGKLLYEEGSAAAHNGDLKGAAAKYAEMVRFVEQLEQQFQKAEPLIKEAAAPAKKGKEDEPGLPRVSPRQELRQALGTLKKYGLLGGADLEYRAGNYDKVLSKELAGGVLAQVEALGKAGEKISMPDYRITGDILALALRAQVQKGNVKGAQETLRLIQRLTDAEGRSFDPTAPLRTLLADLQAQIKDMRAKGEQAKLKQVVGTFGAFFDTLAQGGEKTALKRADIIFLANCYNSLDEYEKAAKLYAQVKPPTTKPPVLDPAKAEDEKAKEEFEKAKQEYERERQAYWLMQCFYGTALRKSGHLDEAKKVLDRILHTKDAVGQLLAQKEEIHILEEKALKKPELWGNAIVEWGKFMKNPSLIGRAKQDPEAKKVYFETYFQYSQAWFRYSQTPKIKGTPKEQTFVNRAADYALRLERNKNQEGWRIAGPLFHELLRREPVLNRAYAAMKKGS